MTGKQVALTRRTLVAGGTTGAVAGLCAPFVRLARAAPTTIRYATGGGIGPNEMETVIYLEWMQKNVLKGRHARWHRCRPCRALSFATVAIVMAG
jgi:hypothetical protein